MRHPIPCPLPASNSRPDRKHTFVQELILLPGDVVRPLGAKSPRVGSTDDFDLRGRCDNDSDVRARRSKWLFGRFPPRHRRRPASSSDWSRTCDANLAGIADDAMGDASGSEFQGLVPCWPTTPSLSLPASPSSSDEWLGDAVSTGTWRQQPDDEGQLLPTAVSVRFAPGCSRRCG